MDDVKQVIMRFQDQKLLDEQAADGMDNVDGALVTSAGETSEEEISVDCASSNRNQDNGNALGQLQLHTYDDVTLLWKSPSNAGSTLGLRYKPASTSNRTPPPVGSQTSAPIKLPLQMISDRMNWSTEYQVTSPADDTIATTATVPSTGWPSLALSEARRFGDSLAGFTVGQIVDVVNYSPEPRRYGHDVDNECFIEADENLVTSTVVPIGCYCYGSNRCHGNHNHATGNGCGSSGEDDYEVCAAFDGGQPPQSRYRCVRQRVAWPLSVNATFRILSRPSPPAATLLTHQHCVPRPSLDFNKMQKTSLSGRVRRKSQFYLRRRHRRQAVKLLRYWAGRLKRYEDQQSSCTSEYASADSNASLTSSFCRHHDDTTADDQRVVRVPKTVGDLDPAVFRFRSIWLDAAGGVSDQSSSAMLAAAPPRLEFYSV